MSTIGIIIIALGMLSLGILIGMLVHKDNYIDCLEEKETYQLAFTEIFNRLPKEIQEEYLKEQDNKNDKLDKKI